MAVLPASPSSREAGNLLLDALPVVDRARLLEREWVRAAVREAYARVAGD
jgi:hypothetical protein